MRESLANGSPVEYVALRHGSFTEHEALDLLHHYKRDLGKRKFMDHVHNLRSKAQGACFDEFLQSVIANLRQIGYVQLVKGCNNFKAFAEMLSLLREDKRNSIMSACKVFCDKYNLEPGFWEQSSAIEGLNADRNIVSHCSVADSAAAIIEAAQKADEYPADVAWAMLGALANYSTKNADALEATVLTECQKLATITGRYRQRLKQQ